VDKQNDESILMFRLRSPCANIPCQQGMDDTALEGGRAGFLPVFGVIATDQFKGLSASSQCTGHLPCGMVLQ
jgi:hypothetical protein